MRDMEEKTMYAKGMNISDIKAIFRIYTERIILYYTPTINSFSYNTLYVRLDNYLILQKYHNHV